ncbi:MAG: spermidine synthase [Patescibacteria group bacterium]
MNIKSFFKRVVFGSEIVARVSSQINGEILITEDLFGHREMVIGRVCQSGGLVRALWQELFKRELKNYTRRKLKVLVLGLGCGTVAELIREKLSEAEITGVEIDSHVVDIGRKYFSLEKVSGLEIVVTDAFTFKNDYLYDLVLVDLYLGQEFPQQAETTDFLQKIKSMMAKDGLVVFNRLYFNRQHRENADVFLGKVRQIYPFVKTQKAVTNLLILASFEARNGV